MSDASFPAIRHLRFWVALAITGCSGQPLRGTAPEYPINTTTVPYPSVDAALGEHLHPNEEAAAEQISGAIEGSIRTQYSNGSARRDAHPKAHGCVKAEVQVVKGLPEALAKGVFIPGKTYQAWIRFSNGSGDPSRADIKRDAVEWRSNSWGFRERSS